MFVLQYSQVQRSVEIAETEVPSSAVLKAQIAEATHKSDAQEASSAVLQAYSKVQSLA